MSQTDNTRQVVESYLSLLTKRDERIVDLFAEPVDWFIQGDERIPWIGRQTKRKEIMRFFRILWSNTEPLSATIDHILVDGCIASIAGEFSTRMLRTGREVASVFAIHIEVEDGRIARYRLLEDSFAVSAAMTRRRNERV